MDALLFDLDGTLYDYETHHRAGLSAAHAAIGPALGLDAVGFEAAYLRARRAAFHRLGEIASAHSRELYFQALVESVRGRTEVPLVLAGLDAYWEGCHRAMAPFPGVPELLERARSRGMRLAVVTDLTSGVQLRKLSRLGLDGFFERVVTSEEAGADKPDPRPFRLALSALGVSPREAVMVGDSRDRDVEGALRVGIGAVWVRGDQAPTRLAPGARAVVRTGDLASGEPAAWIGLACA